MASHEETLPCDPCILHETDQADATISFHDDRTVALHSAARKGSLKSVQLLVQTGAKLSRVGQSGETPLMAAASEGHQLVVECLLHNFNAVREGMSTLDYINMTYIGGRTAMHRASNNCRLDVINFLISQGGDPQVRDSYSETPLHLAALNSHSSALKVLLAAVKEADREDVVNSCDYLGDSLLIYAIRGGSLECVQLLVQAGAKLSQVSCDCETNLMAAASKGDHKVVDFLLLNFDAEKEHMSKIEFINMEDKVGWTAMHHAANNGDVIVIRSLYNQGGDTQSRNHHNNTVLHLAAAWKHSGAVRVLIEAVNEADRADFVNYCNDDGDTALHSAVKGGSLECVDILVQAGAKLSGVSCDGNTTLMAAAWKGHREIVEYLLENFDADREGVSKLDFINATDESGKVVFDRASSECCEVTENWWASLVGSR